VGTKKIKSTNGTDFTATTATKMAGNLVRQGFDSVAVHKRTATKLLLTATEISKGGGANSKRTTIQVSSLP